MKILHISPNASYTEGWSYQENLLPKYQVKKGHDVTLIVSNYSRPNKELIKVECDDKISSDGFRVIRKEKKYKSTSNIISLFNHIELYDLLKEIQPDFIHFHGLGDATLLQVAKYKKKEKPSLCLVVDNHLDYNIGFDPEKNIWTKILRLYYRVFQKLINKYVDAVYGVTPWRAEYAMDVYGIPRQKISVLIMGADDEKLRFNKKQEIRRQVREQYGIENSDFLIVTGGKIDKDKNIHILMKACMQLPQAKLLIFGNVLDDVKNEFYDILNHSKNIIYIGWIDSDKVYDFFFASDLVCFPGQHSVLWEQACASKIPCLFKRWIGMNQVDNGGNSEFLDEITEKGIKNKLLGLINTDKYREMKKIAESEKTDIYLYSNIAEKSLERMKNV